MNVLFQSLDPRAQTSVGQRPRRYLASSSPRPVAMSEPRWDDEQERDVIFEEKVKVKRPRLFKVLLHNDDYTTTDFVVDILVRHFNKPLEEATRIMLQVHYGGTGIAGIYPREVAETKVEQVTVEAERQQMPLLVTMEPE